MFVCEKKDYQFKLTDADGAITIFRGFRQADEPSDLETIVVVWSDGEPECWFLEPGNGSALDDLIAYYETLGFYGAQYHAYDPRLV